MSCLPSDQMPPDGRAVVLYPSCAVGINQDEREVAIVLNHPDGEHHLSPALLLNEKKASLLILQLQSSLRFLQQLPI